MEYEVVKEKIVEKILNQFKEVVLIGVMPFLKDLPTYERQVLFDMVRCVKIELTRIPINKQGVVLDLSLPRKVVCSKYIFDLDHESDQVVPLVDIQTQVMQYNDGRNDYC